MKFKKSVGIIILTAILGLTACQGNGEKVETDIINGSFEQVNEDGSWTGWIKKGTAFSARGAVKSKSINGIDLDVTGTYWFSGLDGGTQKMYGTLTSNTFKLGGTGKIAFKMGAAKHGDKIYIEFFEKGNDTPLLKVTNEDYNEPFITDHLIRKIADLSEHVGKEIYIVITDNDKDDDFGYVNLDDFVICQNEEDVKKYQDERTEQLNKYAEPAFEEDPTSNTIQNGNFEDGLNGWKIVSGTAFSKAAVAPSNQYYWTDRSVYAEGNYYLDGNNNGAIAESAVGVMRSTKFTLAGDGFISFMIGAGASKCHIAINDGTTGEELIKVTNNTFNDPKLPLTLRRVYVDASEHIGKVLYISIVDENSTGGFGFITADDFKVSLTAEEVKALMKNQLNKVYSETYDDSYNSLAALKKYYETYDYPFPLPALLVGNPVTGKALPASDSYDLTKLVEDANITYEETVVEAQITKVKIGDTTITEGFETFDLSEEGEYEVFYGASYQGESIEKSFIIVVSSSANVANGGFETGDLTGWTVVEGTVSENSISANQTYWGEKIPYNQTGTYHFDGWDTGNDEKAGYTLRSTTFTLSGSGYVSFKMGGNAARVRVSLEDGTVIGYFENYCFKDEGFPSVKVGRWATMTTYYYDFSAYLGKKMYVEIIDDASATGWAIAFFDDINFYYEEIPTIEGGYDEVYESQETGEIVRINHEYAKNALLINGGFETGDLTGWTSDTVATGVISSENYWNEKLPYNQGGNYHLNGWETEIAEGETWVLKSEAFTLLGSGFISVKMGGHAAALKVYKADGTLIGYYKQTRFNDNNFPNVDLGGSWADMGTYIIDLHEYLGEDLYLELCDEAVTGWANAFFDDVNTYYETAPDYENGYDTVKLYSKDEDDLFTVEREYQIKYTLAENLA